MYRLSYSEAWKHYNIIHPSSEFEIRSVRLGLCTDGFSPHGAFGKKISILTYY